MRHALRENRRLVVGAVLVSIPFFAALAILVLGRDEALHLLQVAMAILGGLLILKAAVVFLTVSVRLVR